MIKSGHFDTAPYCERKICLKTTVVEEEGHLQNEGRQQRREIELY